MEKGTADGRVSIRNYIVGGIQMKKKTGVAISLFVAAFVIAYFVCSFCIPEWKVKLEADAITVFIENLKVLWPTKALISLAVGAVIASVPFWLRKKEP